MSVGYYRCMGCQAEPLPSAFLQSLAAQAAAVKPCRCSTTRRVAQHMRRQGRNAGAIACSKAKGAYRDRRASHLPDRVQVKLMLLESLPLN